jgi:hypothetical protein
MPSPKSSSPATKEKKKQDRALLTHILKEKTHVVIKKQLLDEILKEEEVITGTEEEEEHGIVGTLTAKVSKYEYDNTGKIRIISNLQSVIFTPVEYPQLIDKPFRKFDPHTKFDDKLIPQTYCDKTFNLPLTDRQQLEKKYYHALGGNRRKTSKKRPVRTRKTNRRR